MMSIGDCVGMGGSLVFDSFPCVLVWAGLAVWSACVCGGGRDYKIRWLGGVFVWVSFGVTCFVHGLP